MDKKFLSDEEILEFALKHSIPPWKASTLLMEKGLIPERYRKNLGVFTIEDQIKLSRSKILVCGCGGLGGFVINALARIGAGYLKLVDYDRFEPSNLNRQLFCTTLTIKDFKAEATVRALKNINPLVGVDFFNSIMQEKFVEEIDIVVDCLDNPKDKIYLEKMARNKKKPLVHGAVRAWWGQVTTIMPESSITLESSIYSNSAKGDQEEQLGVLVMSVAIVGSIQANEVVKIATGKRPSYENKLFYWDGETGISMVIPL